MVLCMEMLIHHFISDHILGLQPWLDNNTMCSFPYPWANQSTQSQNSKRHITKTKNEYKQNWQNAYLGTYGHRLFGNITVTYNQSNNVLQFKAGKYGEGFLHRDQGEMFAVELTGASWYIQNTGDPEPPYFIPPVRFHDQQDGVWMGLESPAHESSVFRRGVKWTDPDPPRPTYFPPPPNCPSSLAPGLCLNTMFYITFINVLFMTR